MNLNQLTAGVLFAGGGVVDSAILKAGFRIDWANEMNSRDRSHLQTKLSRCPSNRIRYS